MFVHFSLFSLFIFQFLCIFLLTYETSLFFRRCLAQSLFVLKLFYICLLSYESSLFFVRYLTNSLFVLEFFKIIFRIISYRYFLFSLFCLKIIFLSDFRFFSVFWMFAPSLESIAFSFFSLHFSNISLLLRPFVKLVIRLLRLRISRGVFRFIIDEEKIVVHHILC
jgi:hypothetical protein